MCDSGLKTTLVTLALVMGGCGGGGGLEVQGPAAQQIFQRYSGIWALDARRSDDPGQKLREANLDSQGRDSSGAGRPGAGQGGAGAGGRGGGFPGGGAGGFPGGVGIPGVGIPGGGGLPGGGGSSDGGGGLGVSDGTRRFPSITTRTSK